MKKLVLGYLLLAAGIAGAACVGPYCYTDTGATMAGVNSLTMNSATTTSGVLGLPVASSTTINGITPVIGQMVVCNSCANAGSNSYGVCIATATTRPSFVLLSSTTLACQ